VDHVVELAAHESDITSTYSLNSTATIPRRCAAAGGGTLPLRQPRRSRPESILLRARQRDVRRRRMSAWRHARARLGRHRPRRRLGDAVFTPILFLVSLASLALTTAPLLLLFWLMQPATHLNPGVSAYDPPPGTRAEPIAHRGGSRDQSRELSSATNFAREYSPPELAEDAQLQEIQEIQENQVSIQASTKREVRRTGRKQSRVGYRRRYEQAAHAYAQERNDYWQPRYR